MTKNALPHGATGVDLGEAVISFAKDKLIMSRKGGHEHLTVHFGSRSQILDIHKTCNDGGYSTHTRLFSIPHENFVALAQEIALPIAERLAGVIRYIDTARMARQRVGAIVGILPTGAEVEAVTSIRHRKLVVDPRKIAADTWAPEFLEELYELEDGETFVLLSCKNLRRPRRIGYGFPFTNRIGLRCLAYIPDKCLIEALYCVQVLLKEAAARYGTFHQPLPWEFQ